MPPIPKKPTAIAKLERSQLLTGTVQRELMGDVIDLEHLTVYLKSQIRFDSVDRITDITVDRTIEGASTVTIILNDHDRAILRTGLLNSRLDIQLDGLWFRLVKVNKSGDMLSLTFEDREIAVLRTYNKLKLVHRSKSTRAEFVLNLIREVKEFYIPRVIPELNVVQPLQIDTSATGGVDYQALLDKVPGIADDVNKPVTANPQGTKEQVEARGGYKTTPLTIKTHPITKAQKDNCDTIITVGRAMKARRKVVVTAIMTAITETSVMPIADKAHGGKSDLDSAGVFQQRPGWGNYDERMNVATSARLYYLKAIPLDGQDATIPYGEFCQDIQVSAYPDRYQNYKDEAEAIVTAYGMPGGDGEATGSSMNNQQGTQGDPPAYIFYRGKPLNSGKQWKKEDSWTCIQRLAGDVQWRAFFVSGIFYFISDDDLFKSKPIAVITEFSDGIEGIDGDYDNGKKVADLTLTVRVGTWMVPPGAVIVLHDMGPFNGRWLVNTFSRSLFNSKATVVLKKPLPRLPEPLQNDINDLTPGWATVAPDIPDPVYGKTGVYVNPLPTPMGTTSEFDIIDAEGAPDASGVRHHAGKDWFAPAGTKVVAPIAGELIELRTPADVAASSSNPAQVFGGVVKLQQDNGYVWVFRHVVPRPVWKVGARVPQGKGIATVFDGPTKPHAHIEIWRHLTYNDGSGYVYENMIDPIAFITGDAA